MQIRLKQLMSFEIIKVAGGMEQQTDPMRTIKDYYCICREAVFLRDAVYCVVSSKEECTASCNRLGYSGFVRIMPHYKQDQRDMHSEDVYHLRKTCPIL